MRLTKAQAAHFTIPPLSRYVTPRWILANTLCLELRASNQPLYLLQYALQPIESLSLRQVSLFSCCNCQNLQIDCLFASHPSFSAQMLDFGRAALYNQSFVLESACRVQREVQSFDMPSQATVDYFSHEFLAAVAKKVSKKAHGPSVLAIHCCHQSPHQESL